MPYRDSLLTRLLKPTLSGRCQTQMLVCISPAARDAGESVRVLAYAAEAQRLVGHPRTRLTEAVDADPMAGDVVDQDDVLQRRCVWIQVPGFGEIFARVVGVPTDPLVLYVHGSGPQNSSMVWNSCAVDTARRLSGATGSAHYHVAIDCPGYGRSIGDRQTIRSYPAAFLSAVVRATGHHRAAALVGSSQGACAVFNALLEVPKLSERVAVCHPVGHAVERYQSIVQPALLAFDLHDDGHPVGVGRRMRAALPKAIYYEYSEDDGPRNSWLEAHYAGHLAALIATQPPPWPAHRGKEIPELARLAGGVVMWSTQHLGEYGPWYNHADDAHEEGGGMATGGDELVPVEEHGLSSSPAPARKVLVLPEDQADEALFSDSEASDEDAMEAKAASEAAAKHAAEIAQTACDLCTGSLGPRPLRLATCRHALCECCVLQSVYLLSTCPCCGECVQRTGKQSAIGMPRSDVDSVAPQLFASDAEAEEVEVAAQAAKAKAKAAVLLEYGNTSRPAGGKTTYTTFVRVLRGGDANVAIKRVGFNINPSYDKATQTVNRPNDKRLGFAFGYAMGRPYPCVMTVEFEGDTMPPLTINYYVSNVASAGAESGCVARRLAIPQPLTKVKRKSTRGKAVWSVLDANEFEKARDAWVT